jgi:hypothetical protein
VRPVTLAQSSFLVAQELLASNAPSGVPRHRSDVECKKRIVVGSSYIRLGAEHVKNVNEAVRAVGFLFQQGTAATIMPF